MQCLQHLLAFSHVVRCPTINENCNSKLIYLGRTNSLDYCILAVRESYSFHISCLLLDTRWFFCLTTFTMFYVCLVLYNLNYLAIYLWYVYSGIVIWERGLLVRWLFSRHNKKSQPAHTYLSRGCMCSLCVRVLNVRYRVHGTLKTPDSDASVDLKIVIRKVRFVLAWESLWLVCSLAVHDDMVTVGSF